MKGLRKRFRRGLAGFLAFVLTMTSFNMVSWADVASAFDKENATFIMNGEDLRDSAQAAIDNGNEFNFEDLGADTSDRSLAKEYRKLFESGTVFEFSPSYDMDDEEYADGAELRMFIRVDDAYEGYQITGDEDIIFLYINDSASRITFRSKIDGYTTQKVTVKGNSSLLETNGAAVSGGENADAAQLPDADEETNSAEEMETPDADKETDLNGEVETSEAIKETDSNGEAETSEANKETEPEDAVETPEAKEGTESGETAETSAAYTETEEKSEVPDANTSAAENSNLETGAGQSDAVQTPDANTAEENQTSENDTAAGQISEGDGNTGTSSDENAAASSSDNNSSADTSSDKVEQLSISRHLAYVLTTAISNHEETEEKANDSDDGKNSNASDLSADHQETAEEPQSEEADNTESGAEINEDPTIALPVETENSNDAVKEEEQTTVSSEEMSQADEEAGANGKPDEKESAVTVEPSTEVDEQEEKTVSGNTSGKTYGQIVLDESYYAKAYVTTLNKLHVDVSAEGYAVTYTVTPVGAATVKGAKSVPEGNDLSFTVKPQVGYMIDRVTANGEELEAVDDSEATDSNASSLAERYLVASVAEEQEIVVFMSETGEHPEFHYSRTLGDVVVSLHAEEGILPAGTVAKVTEVTEKVEEAVKEKTAEETGDDTSENTVLAYDIKLFAENDEGELEALDNSWSENGYVDVTFSGKAIEEKSAEAETVEIKHVDIGEVDVTADDVSKITAEEVQTMEDVSEVIEVPGDAKINEVAFEAEHFSIYTIYFSITTSSEINIITVDTNGNVIGNINSGYYFSSDEKKSVESIAKEITPAGYEPDIATIGGKYSGGKVDTKYYDKSQAVSVIQRTGVVNKKLQYKVGNTAYKEMSSDTQDIYFWVNPKVVTITFNLNNGTGTVPQAITAQAGQTIDLPSSDGIHRNNYIMLGWAEQKDSNTVPKSTGNAIQIYSLNGKFEVPGKDVILYAAWAQTDGSRSNDTLVVAIRKDGLVPSEPTIRPDSENEFYTYITGSKGVSVGNILGYLNQAHTTAGVEAVSNNLKTSFLDYVNDLNSNNKYWNPDTHYIEWYVIKYQGNDSKWHIDGAIRDRSKVSLDYRPNCNDYTGHFPDSEQYTPGTMAAVSGAGTMTRPGYIFNGWDTEREGTGVRYYENDRIKMTQSVILYAQWIEKNTVSIYYKAVDTEPNVTGGEVSNKSENLNPDTGIAAGSTAKAYRGYCFVGWFKEAEAINKITENNTLSPQRPEEGWINNTTFYAVFAKDYSKTFNYTIEYYKDGEDQPFETVGPKQVYQYAPEVREVSYDNKPQGYRVDMNASTVLPFTVSETDNIIKVYYVTDETQKNFAYKINYYIKGGTTKVPGIETNPVTGKGYVNQVVKIEHPVVTTGYKVMAGQPTSLVVRGDGKSEETVYYEIDESQKDFAYKIKYFIKGGTTKVPGINPNPVVGKGYINEEILVEHPNVTTGYKVMENQPTKLIVKEDGTAETTVFYEIDEGQKNFAYKINYFIKGGTTKVPGIEPNPAEGKGYINEVIKVKHPTVTTGYKVMKDQPTSLLVKEDGTAETTVFYEIDESQKDFAYKINYFIKGGTTKVPGIDPNPVEGTGYINEVITVKHPTVTTGYKVMKDQPTSLIVKEDGTAETTVFYEIDESQKDFAYKINYFIKGGTTKVPGIEPNPVVGKGYINEIITVEQPIVTTGYKVMENQPTSLMVKEDGTATATVYYEIDESQKDFAYKINYFIKGGTTKVPGINPNPVEGNGYINEVITIGHPIVTTGYKVMKGQPTSLVVKADGTAEETVYYEADEAQKDFAYKINYFIKGGTTKVPGIDPNPIEGKGYIDEVITIEHPTVKTGYKVMKDQPANLIVKADGKAEATVYYEIDESQKDFAYKIDYFIKGGTTKVPGIKPNPVEGEGHINEVITIDHPTVTTGYKVMEDQPTSLIVKEDGTAKAIVYYEVDENQKNFGYKINYFIKGGTTKVPGIDPNPVVGKGYINEKILVEHPIVTTGYKVMENQPTSLVVKEDGTAEVTVYYEVDHKQKNFGYKINYFINGGTTKVPGISPNPVEGKGYINQVISIDHPEVDTGYKVCEDQPRVLIVKEDGTAEANVFYEVDKGQKDFAYKINYFIKGGTIKVPGIEPNPVEGKGYINEVIAVEHPVVTTGYKVMKEQPTSLIVTEDGTAETTVFYEIDESQNNFSYKINYFIKGGTTKVPGIDPNPVEGTGYINEVITVDHPTVTTGYKVMKDQPTSLIIKEDEKAEATVYYEIDESQKDFAYKINYFIKGGTIKVPGIEPNPVEGKGYINEVITVEHPVVTTGYKVMENQPASLVVKEDGKTEATVYYEVDESQKDFAYKINYFIKGGTTKVPGIDPNPVEGKGFINEVINIKHPLITTGYKVMENQPTSLVVREDGTSEATVYYEVDEEQRDFSYKVNYFIKGGTTKVPGIEPNPVEGNGYINEVITVDHPVVNTGYKVMKNQPISLIVKADGTAEATVYYEVDKEQKFDYEIYYYIYGGTDAVPGITPNPFKGKGYLGEEINIIHPNVSSYGYRVMKDQPDKLVINGPEKTTQIIYYELRNDLITTINYYYDNVKADSETLRNFNAIYGDLILKDILIENEVTRLDGKHYVLDGIDGRDKRVTVKANDNVVNIYYALDEKGVGPDPNKPDQIPDKYQITFTYTASANGKVEGRLEEVVTREKEADGSFSTTNPAYPEALVTASADSGYRFVNWTSSEVGTVDGEPVSTFAAEADIRKAGFTTDSIFTAHFNAKDDTTYRVEYYYESQGRYPASTDNYEIRTGKTDAAVSVADSDKVKAGYVYDTTASNVESGIVKGDNSLVLKLYFKQQFTVTYQPGDHEFFTEQVIGGISYGDKTPEFTGIMDIRGKYVFNGWKPVVAENVTENAVYVAQWKYTGSSDGGNSGGGNTPNPDRPYVPGGPGETVTVEPGDVPLANLPESGPADNLILIDDGNVPLAGLPKTGDRTGAHAGLAALLSGFLLAAFTVLSSKKREEEK